MLNTFGLKIRAGWFVFRSWFSSPFRVNWTESIHFVAIAIGVLGSGFWAIQTFELLSAQDNAEAELKQTNAALGKAKLEYQELKEKIEGTVSSDITMQVKGIDLPNNKVGLIIDVVVKNNGTRETDIVWDKSPLVVYKTFYEGDKVGSNMAYRPYIYGRFKSSGSKSTTQEKSLYLLVGAKKELSFFLEVEPENLYYISFEANVDVNLEGVLKKSGKSARWFSAKYFYAQRAESDANAKIPVNQ